MTALAESTEPREQLPARMLLELVGDKDTSWSNAQKSLRDGTAFKKEIFEMEGDKFVTRGALGRFDALGQIDLGALESNLPASFAMAVYLEAIIEAAKEKLGIAPKDEVGAPAPEK